MEYLNERKGYIDYLDGWRGIAIMLVLMEHFFRVEWINVGRLGVDFFFVLSGMLMANILFVKKTSLVTFYKRRISRVFPVFFVYLSSISIASYIFNLSDEHENYFYSLFFLRTYFPDSPGIWFSGIPIGHFWSLNVEEHSYVILSILAAFSIFYKNCYLYVLAIGLAAILVGVFYKLFPAVAPDYYYARTEVACSFLMLSAGYSLIKDRLEKNIPPWLPVVCLVFVVVCYSPYALPGGRSVLAPLLLAFSFNHINLMPVFFRNVMSFYWLRLLGVWSFSIYIWQQPFYYYGVKFGDAFYFAGPVLFCFAIAVGVFSFVYIENPVRRFLNNRW